MPVDPTAIRYDLTLQTEISKLLNTHYPTMLKRHGVDQRVHNVWHVIVQDNVARVRHLMLSGEWGFNCRLTGAWKIDSRKVIYYAGELMDRFNAARGSVDLDALKNLPTDFIGRPIGDHS